MDQIEPGGAAPEAGGGSGAIPEGAPAEPRDAVPGRLERSAADGAAAAVPDGPGTDAGFAPPGPTAEPESVPTPAPPANGAVSPPSAVFPQQPAPAPQSAVPPPHAAPGYPSPAAPYGTVGAPPYGAAAPYGAPAPAPSVAPRQAEAASDPAEGGRPRISVGRALREIGLVYAASFGLGIVSAIALLTEPSLDSNQVITGTVDALGSIFQYVMQAAVVIFGVGYFAQRRGWTLSQIFGHFVRPKQYVPSPSPWTTPAASQRPAPQPPAPAYPYPQPGYNPYAPPAQQPQASWPNYVGNPHPYGHAAPYPYAQPQPSYPPSQYPAPPQVPAWGGNAQPGAYPAYGAYPPPAAYYPPVREPGERSSSWQFTRAFYTATAGMLAFLFSAVIYSAVTHQQTGAPSMGHSLWLLPVGLVTALAAGFGEELLVTGMVVTTLEQAGLRNKAWVIYLVAIALRIPFHLYYGWASLGVILFTVVNIWVYRRWRLLWPIVIAHAVYDGVQFLAEVNLNLGSLLLDLLVISTVVMLFVILGIELHDRSARRRFDQWKMAAGLSS